MMAEHLGIRLHEIEIAPTSSTCCRGWSTSSTSRSVTRRRSTPLLMCEAARAAGVKVLLSGMGADELFGGYRKHLACLLSAAATGACRAVCATGVVGPTRAAGCPSWSRRPRDPHRPLGTAVPHLRRARGGGGVPAQLHAATTATSWSVCSTPSWPAASTSVLDGHRAVYADTRPRRPGQPDVPGGHPDVHDRAQPDLHRPGQHGRLHARSACRSSTRWSSRRPSRCPARTRSAAGCRRPPSRTSARAWLPDEIIDRPKASFGVPLRAWVTNDLGAADRRHPGRRRAGRLGVPAAASRCSGMVADQRAGRRD